MMRWFGHINRTNEALITAIYKERKNESRPKWKQKVVVGLVFKKKETTSFTSKSLCLNQSMDVQRPLANIRKYGKAEWIVYISFFLLHVFNSFGLLFLNPFLHSARKNVIRMYEYTALCPPVLWLGYLIFLIAVLVHSSSWSVWRWVVDHPSPLYSFWDYSRAMEAPLQFNHLYRSVAWAEPKCLGSFIFVMVWILCSI